MDSSQDTSIFVQIASYRDPELIPTLIDLIDKTTHPRRLRIVVCWQHGPGEKLGDFWARGFGKWRTESWRGWTVHLLENSGASIELIDVPHMQTRGACWARHLLQQRYGGERYTLQLDSHHRFIEGWNEAAIVMLESLRDESPKPVLTTYLPFYNPEHGQADYTRPPGIMVFLRFTPEGVVLFDAKDLPDWKNHDRPIPARFYSAHFAFADGHFAETVQHDPDFFFHGEEISIGVRAFTHGYDLYHPHRVLAFHEYTRRHRVKMWDDHTHAAKEKGDIVQDWWDIDRSAMQRHRALLGIDGQPLGNDFGQYGLGTERGLADFETYAGLSFAHRGVQAATLDHQYPVRNTRRPPCEADWLATMVRSNSVRVCIHQDAFESPTVPAGDEPLLDRAKTVQVTFYDAVGAALHGRTLKAQTLARWRADGWLDATVSFTSPLGQAATRYLLELRDEEGNVLASNEQSIPEMLPLNP
ncbi:GlcNAc-transferase family protein [Dyella sp.]|uniref:GlcNAc-transferase family protein n=1 Tax=Dyella sp. TaxID=1869338 RepID=UPI002B45E364|nr:GlcNAc-transferase family protein [Dyella sp.]HKT27470.1 GlcNAc-transferase family protein [Dyella sp.]